MERSPEYYNALDQVRHMPQSAEVESVEKREQAKLLRMRVMFDNARCAELLTEYEQEHPFATEEEIETMLEQDGVLRAHPEVIENFLVSLKWSKQAVLDALEELKREDGTYETDRLFQWMAKDPTTPKSVGTLEIETEYPFALIVYVKNKKDFQRIDRRKDIGGFYQPDVFPPEDQSQKDPSPLFPLQFPLIAIRGSRNPIDMMLTERHEIGHSHNNMLKTSESPHHLFWGEIQPLGENDIQTLQEAWRQNPATSRETPEWRNALTYMYSRAKDELLADYFASEGSFYHVRSLLKQGGVYDYASKYLGIPPSSDLYNALWDEYRATLEVAIKSANNITEQYMSLSLDERIDAFRWVLAQIPLDQWERQLRGTMFLDEVDALKNLDIVGNLDPREEARELISALQAHQHEPLMPYINKFRNTIPDQPPRKTTH